nr:tumor necrosis factor receptor superfamily member 10C [Pan troglodytes]
MQGVKERFLPLGNSGDRAPRPPDGRGRVRPRTQDGVGNHTVARIPNTLKFVVVIVVVLLPVLAYSATTARQEEVPQQTVAPQQQRHSFEGEECPAGSHRSEHTGACNPCTEGVDYTNASNNEPSCFPCTVCKSDQKHKSSCTMTRDTVCQCKEGTFRNENSPEMCRKCSRCPSGEVQVSNCTSWDDIQCVEEFGASATVETPAAEETMNTSPGTPAPAAEETMNTSPGTPAPAAEETMNTSPGTPAPAAEETMNTSPGTPAPAAEEKMTTSPGTPASSHYLSCTIVGIIVLIVLLIVFV